MLKRLKVILAVLMLPLCWGALRALWRVLQVSGQAEAFWVLTLAGAASWVSVFLMLPKPTRLYIFGHELTHVLWALAFGARVKKFKVSSKGGQVQVTRSNFLVVLAPYFFPLYAVLLVAVYVLASLVIDCRPYRIVFYLLLGAAYGFHVTLTLSTLQVEQPDLLSQGYLFSGVVIVLGNLLVLLVGVPLLTGEVRVTTALWWWLRDSVEWIGWLPRPVWT